MNRRINRVVVFVVFLMGISCGSGWAQNTFDRITHTVTGNVETWKITEPDVTVPSKSYPAIRFKKGDQVEVLAGGCVNIGPGGETGKSKMTWRNYRYPKLDYGYNNFMWERENCHKLSMSPSNYGMIHIPGVTTELKPIYEISGMNMVVYGVSTVVDKKIWDVGEPGSSDFLQLGYKDTKYSDNSYTIPDPPGGYCNQCSGDNAWVQIIITHLKPEITVTPETSVLNAPLNVSYKDVPFQQGMKIGLFSENGGSASQASGLWDIHGPSGTLSVNAPSNHGRYVFRLVDAQGQIRLSGKMITVIPSISSEAPVATGTTVKPETRIPGKADSKVASVNIRPGRNIKPDTNCGPSLSLPAMEGYAIAECVKRFDEGLILMNADPESVENPRYEGEKTTVKYEWMGDGPSPSELKIRKTYENAAKDLGANVRVNRNRYTAFTVSEKSQNNHVAVEIFNDGRTVILTVIESELAETGN